MEDKREKSLAEINAEYQSLIKEDREADYLSAQETFQYIQNSTAKYHGRCVRTLYIPKIFREADIKIFEKAVTDLYGIFDKVMKAYAEDAEYRKLFGFDKTLEELILREKTYASNIPIARIDIFYNEENGDDIFFVDATLWVPLAPLHPLRDGHKIIAEKLTAILKEKLGL